LRGPAFLKEPGFFGFWARPGRVAKVAKVAKVTKVVKVAKVAKVAKFFMCRWPAMLGWWRGVGAWAVMKAL
jgi:hypothetical protein